MKTPSKNQSNPTAKALVLFFSLSFIGMGIGFSQNNSIFKGGNADGFALGTLGGVGTEVTLPVELLTFTGKCDAGKWSLGWSTASETNNDYFTLERSHNGTDWKVVGKISGAGNSSTARNYSFVDGMPQSSDEAGTKTRYYRLKQTDYDGKSKYHSTIALESCATDAPEYSVYPNPTTGKVFIQSPSNEHQPSSIEIYNLQGVGVYSAQASSELIDLDLAQLPNDIYIVQIKSVNGSTQQKIIVQK